MYSCIEKYRKPNSSSAKMKYLKTIKYLETRIHETYAAYLSIVCVPLFPFGHVHNAVTTCQCREITIMLCKLAKNL